MSSGRGRSWSIFVAAWLLVPSAPLLGVLVAPVATAAPSDWDEANWPNPRYAHNVVALGGLFYFANGYEHGYPSSALDVWDPLSGLWGARAASITPRGDAAAVAFEGRLWSIGGRGFDCTDSICDRVEVYDPSSDSWTVGPSLPHPVAGAAAAVADGRIWLVGGYGSCASGCGPRPDVLAYDPAAGEWLAGPPLPGPLADAVAVAVAGRVYVTAGTAEGMGETALHVLDPTTLTWSLAAPMPTETFLALGAFCGGRILVAGGVSAGAPTDLTQLYDPATDTWTTGPSLPAPRAVLGNGLPYDGSRVVASAGASSEPDRVFVHECAESLDPLPPRERVAWETHPAPPANLVGATGALVGDTYHLLGGYHTWYGTQNLEMFEYHVPTGAWHTSVPPPIHIADAAAVAVDGKLWVLGGYSGSCWSLTCDAVLVYDPALREWSDGPTMLRPHVYHGAVAGADGRVWVVGGSSTSQWDEFPVDVYDPATGTWSLMGSLPIPLIGSAISLESDGLHVIGGHHAAYPWDPAEVHLRMDLETGQWSDEEPPRGRHSYGASGHCGSDLYVAGGGEVDGVTVHVERYDTRTGGWSEAPDMPRPYAALPRGQPGDGSIVVVAGGTYDDADAPPTSVLRCGAAGGTIGLGRPDLAVLDVSAPPTVTRGQTFRVQAVVSNEGDAPSPAFEVLFTPGETRRVLPLLPGQSVTVLSGAIPADESTTNVSVAIDPANRVDESVESNNHGSVTTMLTDEFTRCEAPGPDRFGYTCRVVTRADPLDLPADPEATRLRFDGCTAAVALPFIFEYYGVPRTEIHVDPRGRIHFEQRAFCDDFGFPLAQDELAVDPAMGVTDPPSAYAKSVYVDGTPALAVAWSHPMDGDVEAHLLSTGEIRFVYERHCIGAGSGTTAMGGLAGLRFTHVGCPVDDTVVFAPGSRPAPTPATGADLAVTSLAPDRTTPVGAPLTLTARVENHGTASSPPALLEFTVDGKTAAGTRTIPALAPGESVLLTSDAWVSTVGPHAATAWADRGFVVTETREDDNLRAIAFLVEDTPSPDLVATRLDTIPPTPRAGDATVFQLTLENRGNALADVSAAYFYLDGEHDWTVDAWNTPPIPPGGSAVVEFGPHVVTAGERLLQAHVDPVAHEIELDNNRIERTILVGDGTGANLRASNATATPPVADPGMNVTFETDVENVGTLPAGPFLVAFRLDDGTLVGETRVEGLAAGETLRVASPAWRAHGAPDDFVAVADDRSELPETDESDNRATGDFRVRSPDFVVENFTRDPAIAVQGDVVTFSALVANRGDWPSPASALRFAVDGATVVEDVSIPPLEPGESVQLASWPWVAEHGPHVATATADPSRAVPESDERNNEASSPFVVTARAGISAELVVVDVASTPADPTADDVVNFTAIVGNDGTVLATGFDVRFELDGVHLGTRRVAALAPGQTASVTSDDWEARGGEHTIAVIVDARGEISESNEADNERREAFAPRAADLVATVSVTPAETWVSQTPRAVALVWNNGTLASGAAVAEFSLDGAFIGEVALPPLDPGSSAIMESPVWAAARGDHVVSLQIDVIDEVDEANESNNAASHAFTTKEADLMVTAVTTDPPRPAVGTSTRFRAFVQNAGPDVVPATSLRFTLDTSGSLGVVDVPPLAPGEVVEVLSARFTYPSGFHTITANADDAGRIPEADESNNGLVGATAYVPPSPCQTPGPDAGGYRCFGVPYEWVELGTSGTRLSLADDQVSGAIPLPWTFNYYGSNVSSVHVSSNGFLTFLSGQSNGCCTGGVLPSTLSPNAVVAGYWEDLYPPGGGRISYATRTLDGQQVFIVQFAGVPHYCCSRELVTFQFQLFPDGRIHVMYQDVRTDGGTHTAGIENFQGNAGLVYRRGSFSLATTGVGYGKEAPPSAVLPGAPDVSVGDVTTSPADVQMGDVLSVATSVTNGGGSTAQAFHVAWGPDGTTAGEAFVPALAVGWPLPVRGSFVTPGGAHQARVTADAAGAIPEPDEANNVGEAAYYARWPNLVVTDVAWSPDPIRAGDAVVFQATVRNAGDGDARTTTTTALILDGTTLLGYVPTPPLAAGAGVVVSVEAWNATGGDHAIRATADALQALVESSETDNARVETFRVPLPDLVVEGAATEPAAPVHGDRVVAALLVANRGDAASPATTLRVALDGATLEDLKIPALDPGASATLRTAAFDAVGGDHVLAATADDGSLVVESNESNNRLDHAFRVTQADLRVPRLSWSPASPEAGQVVTLTAEVENVGDAAAGSTVARFTLDGATLADVPLATVAPGETAVAQATWTAAGGDFDVAVLADAGMEVAERNESNNARAAAFRVRVADLLAGEPAATPADPAHGETVELSVPVTNQGDADAGAFRARLLVDGAPAGSVDVPGLAAGASTLVAISWTAVGGDRALRVEIDASEAVLESDESNNAATLRLHVRQAELDVGAASVEPAVPVHGEPATLRLPVTNGGDAATAPFVVRLLVDGETVADATMPGLAPGETGLAELPWTAQGGDHEATLLADALGHVDEQDEADNAATLLVHVAQADLVAVALAADPASPAHGDATTFTLLVRNAGDAAATATSVAFAVGGASLGAVALPALPAGAEATVTSPAWVAVAGDVTAEAVADPEDLVAEASEANGVETLALHVRAPDLVALRVGTDPASPAHGDAVTLLAEVTNAGDADAAAFVVRFTVDGAIVNETEVPALAAGVTVVVEAAWTAVGGARAVAAEVDAAGAVLEASDANNDASTDVHVRQANVVADALTLSPASPAAGDAVVANVVVRNAGDAATGPFAVRVAVDGATVVLDAIVDLAPGESRTLEAVPWNATPGAHVFDLTADALGRVDESSETDNARNASFVSRQPDLVVDAVEASQDLPPNNKDVTFTARVSNVGNADASTFRVRFVLEDGEEVGTVVVEGLAAGASVDVSLPPTRMKLGVHTVTATADDLDQVAELDESNNARSHSFTVTTPGGPPI